MTFEERDMYRSVRNNLRRRFPQSKGWKIYPEDPWKGIQPDFVVERQYRGSIQRVLCEVKAESRIKKDHIDQINRYGSIGAGNARIIQKILAVPRGVEISDTVRRYLEIYEIDLMILNNFYYYNKR